MNAVCVVIPAVSIAARKPKALFLILNSKKSTTEGPEGYRYGRIHKNIDTLLLYSHISVFIYPRGVSDAWVLAVIVCLCLSQAYCIKTAKRRTNNAT